MATMPAMVTILPDSPPAARRPRPPLPLLVAVVLGAGALTTAFFVMHQTASRPHPARMATVTTEAFVTAANSRCLTDYGAVIPTAQANASNPAVLIGLSVQMSRTLATDVSGLPHPVSADAGLAMIRKDSAEMATFVQQNANVLASQNQQPSDEKMARLASLISSLRQAYLALGLSQCVSPQIPGVPHA